MSKFIELENFIIKSDDDIGYFDDVVKQVQSTEVEIMEFFGLKELNPKVTIEIMRYEPFKNHIISKYGEIASYVRGDGSAKDRYIRILDIEDQIKYTSHKNATLENTLLMISHEMVHACDSVNVSNNFYKSIWFREGLATNLSHQDYECIDLSNCDFNIKSGFVIRQYSDKIVYINSGLLPIPYEQALAGGN